MRSVATLAWFAAIASAVGCDAAQDEGADAASLAADVPIAADASPADAAAVLPDAAAVLPDAAAVVPDAAPEGPPEDLDMRPEDFECLKDWDQVRRFRLTNKLGHLEEALAVANNPEGGVYPVGTVLQLIPMEAMVKRRVGFSPATMDWEFFALNVSAAGTEIVTRGKDDVVNAFGGNCLGCHRLAQPQWDLVCETTHGCDPLPFNGMQIQAIQDSDPRCH